MASNYEVYALEYGRMNRSSRDFYLRSPDPHEGPREIVYYVWLIRNHERTIIVDLGFDRRSGDERGRVMIREPLDAFAALGVEVAEVDTVIITHMHYDHVGNVPEFKNAEFVLQEREIAYCTGKPMRYPACNFSFDVEHVTDIVRANFQARVRFVDGDAEIAPGVSVHLVGGHTGGLQFVRVETEVGPLIIASDAAHFYDTVTTGNPFTIIANLPEMMAGHERIFELGAAPERVVPGHDPLVSEIFPEYMGDPLTVVLTGKMQGESPFVAWREGKL